MARRLLLAATTPSFLASEGGRSHLEACLNIFEEGLDWWCLNQHSTDHTKTRDLA